MAGGTIIINPLNRRPIQIKEDEWPVIATAALHKEDEFSEPIGFWEITVRQHQDGRTIVYGGYEDRFKKNLCKSLGVILEAGQNFGEMVSYISVFLDAPRELAQRCLANMEPEEILSPKQLLP